MCIVIAVWHGNMLAVGGCEPNIADSLNVGRPVFRIDRRLRYKVRPHSKRSNILRFDTPPDKYCDDSVRQPHMSDSHRFKLPPILIV